MSAAAIVLVLVASDELREPATAALTRTTEDALEGRAIVVVREARNAGDDDATRLGAALHADVVVVVTWSQPDRGSAFVHLYDAHGARWVDRSFAFRPEDPESERARLVGFEVASMVPIHVDAPPPAEAAPPIALAFDIAGAGAVALGGPGGGGGAELGARVSRGAIGVRAGGGFRLGTLDEANADGSLVRLGAGATLRIFERGARPVRLDARADVLALRDAASRANGSRDAQWTPGLDALGEASWIFAAPVGAMAALGVEVSPSPTRIYVDGARVASLAVVRLVGEVGVRISF